LTEKEKRKKGKGRDVMMGVFHAVVCLWASELGHVGILGLVTGPQGRMEGPRARLSIIIIIIGYVLIEWWVENEAMYTSSKRTKTDRVSQCKPESMV
jgi:hypothetical protein